MRLLIIFHTVLIVFQISNVFITAASVRDTITPSGQKRPPVETTAVRRTVTREVNTQRRTAPRIAEKPAERIGAPEYGADSIDGEEAPQSARPAVKRLARTARDEASKRAAGAADTATELLRFSSDSLGLFGRLVREQLQNLRGLATLKFDMLSGLGRSLTNGAVNVMNGAREVGGEGGRALSGVLRNATKAGRTATQVGGKLLNAPFQVADHALRVGKRVATVPAKLSKTASDAARDALSMVGVHSEEDDDDYDDDGGGVAHPVEIVEDESGDKRQPAAVKTKRTDSRKR